jgi:hypothetical protein
MAINKLLWLIVLVFVAGIFNFCSGKGIHNKHYRYSITLPDRLIEINDSSNSLFSSAYYDSASSLLLMISAQKGTFKHVKDYIDCSHLELEQQLQSDYGDTSLRLISCNISDFYPKKTTLLRFEILSLDPGYSRYIIYFIHHHKYDIQISFTYKKANEASSVQYINGIMETLTLL